MKILWNSQQMLQEGHLSIRFLSNKQWVEIKGHRSTKYYIILLEEVEMKLKVLNLESTK